MAKIKALRDFAFETLENFLYKENFSVNNELVRGVVHLANSICHYEEESIKLSPQILIAADVRSIAKTLPSYTLIPIVQNASLDVKTFKMALKSCAPLAQDNWIIYFDIKDDKIEYGLLASGVSEPNPSPYTHLKIEFEALPVPVIYLKAISSQVLLVKGKVEELVISFSLDEYEYNSSNDFEELASFVTRDLDIVWKEIAKELFVGLFEQAAENSHGCLIVVLDKPELYENLKLEITNGIFIPEPIDIAKSLIDSQQTKDSNAQMILISLCAVIKRMISHDGITLFSSDGKLLGYNLFVPSNDEATKNIIGGARTRAYQKLCNIEELSCVLFRSQDGAMKVFKKEAKQ